MQEAFTKLADELVSSMEQGEYEAIRRDFAEKWGEGSHLDIFPEQITDRYKLICELREQIKGLELEPADPKEYEGKEHELDPELESWVRVFEQEEGHSEDAYLAQEVADAFMVDSAEGQPEALFELLYRERPAAVQRMLKGQFLYKVMDPLREPESMIRDLKQLRNGYNELFDIHQVAHCAFRSFLQRRDKKAEFLYDWYFEPGERVAVNRSLSVGEREFLAHWSVRNEFNIKPGRSLHPLDAVSKMEGLILRPEGERTYKDVAKRLGIEEAKGHSRTLINLIRGV